MWERTLSQNQSVFSASKSDRWSKGGCVCLWVRVAHIICCERSACCFNRCCVWWCAVRTFILIGFIPQRIYIGGYHATSHTRCYLAFSGLALICILLSKAIAANHLFRILTTVALLGISIFLSPIEAKNKPLSEKKRSSYKMVASVLSSIDFLLAIFNVLPYTRHVVCYYLSKWVLIVFSTIPLVQQKFNANFCR